MSALVATVHALVAAGKGLLAMDEAWAPATSASPAPALVPTDATRCAYGELLVSTPGLGAFISSAILYEETLSQLLQDGTPLVQVLAAASIVPGIKVDMGTVELAGRQARSRILRNGTTAITRACVPMILARRTLAGA